MGISDQYCPCGIPLWEGEDYCQNCGQENEWDPVCPNCDEKLDDPDSCDFCRWESGDPLNDSDHLGEDEIPEASRGATANHDQGLLDLLTMALGTGIHLSITNLAVSYSDLAGDRKSVV